MPRNVSTAGARFSTAYAWWSAPVCLVPDAARPVTLGMVYQQSQGRFKAGVFEDRGMTCVKCCAWLLAAQPPTTSSIAARCNRRLKVTPGELRWGQTPPRVKVHLAITRLPAGAHAGCTGPGRDGRFGGERLCGPSVYGGISGAGYPDSLPVTDVVKLPKARQGVALLPRC
jgi:hypothetical protein